MRVVLPVVVSKAMAGTMRSGPAVSATMRRRVANSLVQTRPPIRPFTHKCQSESQPSAESTAMVMAPSAVSTWPAMSKYLRLRLSATAPESAPISSMGKARAISTSDTAKAERVR